MMHYFEDFVKALPGVYWFYISMSQPTRVSPSLPD